MTDRWARLNPGRRQTALDGGAVSVTETSSDGAAEVTFHAPEGWRLERLNLPEALTWLAVRNHADGIVFAQRPDGRWEAHIVECKATVSDNAWGKARQQFRGTRVFADAVAGVVGVELSAAVVYTAYRTSKIDAASSPDPIIAAIPVGSPATRTTPERHAGRVEWASADIAVEGFGRLPHHKVQLEVGDTGVGHGAIQLG